MLPKNDTYKANNFMNKVFEIKANKFEEIKKQLIIKTLPILLISIALGFAISFLNAKKGDLLSTWLIMITLLFLVYGYSLFSDLKKQKMLFRSYKLIFSEHNVIREQINTPLITILFDDIKSIAKNKNGSYTIKGKITSETILVPAQIDDYETLEMLFNQIRPIENFSQPAFDEKYKIPIVILTLFCLGTVYISVNKILVGICALILSGLLIRSLIKVKNNNNIDRKTKKNRYYGSFLVLAYVIVVTIKKIIAN